jgi:hypothetical protein
MGFSDVGDVSQFAVMSGPYMLLKSAGSMHLQFFIRLDFRRSHSAFALWDSQTCHHTLLSSMFG